jgi:cytochrome c556
MKNSSDLPIYFLCVMALLTGCGEIEDTRPGQPVKTRQMAFKEIIKAFEPMGVMLRENRYDAEEFESLANKLETKKDGPWDHFGPETNYPPSRATPEVWAQGDKFEQEHQRFIKTTSALQSAAKTKDVNQVTIAYKKLHETCKSCHKVFKLR